MKEIPLTQGKFALVDDEDFKWLMKSNWNLITPKGRKYAKTEKCTNKKRVCMYMHIEILKRHSTFKEGMDTDHIDGNGINNQKRNLRVCEHNKNLFNRGKQQNNTSGYKGVTWSKVAKKWISQIWCNKNRMHLGLFVDKTEAAKAYNEAAKKYHGEFARLNEI
ncbi:MAG: hypothetical protein GY853_14215 [PVC group bacterium]|nr:hypothetical protein [PVC group bacterium]